MIVTIRNLTNHIMSTDFGPLGPGASASDSVSPDQAYLIATNLKTLSDAGKITVTVADDPKALPALSGGSISETPSFTSVTFTNTTDDTTSTLSMPFGSSFLQLDSTAEGFPGFNVATGDLYCDGPNGVTIHTGDPGNSPNASATYGWQSGQIIYENATGSLSTQYVGTDSNFQVGIGHSNKFHVNANTGDVNAVGTIAAQTALASLGNLSVAGQLWLGGSASATIPGSVVKKIQVFDAAGTSLGYIAIYSAIT